MRHTPLKIAVLLALAFVGCEDLSKRMTPAESERAARRLLAEAARVAGGVEAMKRLGSLRATGTMTQALTLKMTKMYRFRQRQARLEMYSPQLGESAVAIANGDRVQIYELTPRPRKATEFERKQLMLGAMSHPATVLARALDRPPGAVRLVDERTVEVSLDDNLPLIRLTFDRRKRLVAKQLGTAASRYADHRRVGGLLLPFSSLSVPGTKHAATITWTKIELDPPLSRAQILAPPETPYTSFTVNE